MKPSDFVNFNEIDHWPKFDGCAEESSRDCTFNKIEGFIKLNFKKSMLSDSIPDSEKKALVKLFIDTEGQVVRPYVISENPLFKKEILQITSNLPDLTPGVHNGKEAIVIIEIPINLISKEPIHIYKYNDDSLSSSAILKKCRNKKDPKSCTSALIQNRIMDGSRNSKLKLPKNKFIHAMIKFVVDENGLVSQIKIEGSHLNFNNDIKRIIGELPKFDPATVDGKPVKELFQMPVKLMMSN